MTERHFQKENNSHHHHNVFLNFFAHRNVFLISLGVFLLILVLFVIAIFVIVIVDLTRGNDLQTQITSKTQPDTLLNTLKKGLNKMILKENSFNFNLCFSKKYKNTHNDSFIELTNPYEILYNKDKSFINQGKIQIKKHFDNHELFNQTTISFSITSNLPKFSTIILIEINLDIDTSFFFIKNSYYLCSNEEKSDRKCDKSIGKFFRDYEFTFNSESSKQKLIKSKDKFIEEELNGHFNKKISKSIKNHDKDEDDLVISNKIELSKIYQLLFFIDDNEYNHYHNNKSNTDDKHNIRFKNNLGKIAFIIEPTKC